MTVHIGILSDQAIPNLLPVLEKSLAATRLKLIHTKNFERNLEYFRKVLKVRGISVEGILVTDDARYDYTSVESILNHLFDEIEVTGEQAAVNLTGGMKPMSLGAFMAAFNRNVPAYYVDGNDLRWIVGPREGQKQDITHHLNLEAYLNIHGTEVACVGSNSITPTRQDAINYMVDNLADLIRDIPTLNYHWNPRNGSLDCVDTRRRSDALLDYFDYMVSLGLLQESAKGFKPVDDDAAAFLVSGWLELYTYLTARKLLSEHNLPIHCYHSVQIKRYDQRKGKIVPNELDVAILVNNRLFVIECKNRRVKQNNNSAHEAVNAALYKLADLQNGIAGARTQCAFFSTFEVSPSNHDRANVHRSIQLWELERINNLRHTLESWLGI